MVGIQFADEVSERQMEWLVHGGREILYRIAEDAERELKALGMLGYFDIAIFLPTDIVVYLDFKDGGCAFWVFGVEKRDEAYALAESLKASRKDREVEVLEAKEFFRIKEDAIQADISWSGDSTIIFNIFNQAMNAAEAGRVKIARWIANLGAGRRARLPFPIPADADDVELLDFMLEACRRSCSSGDYIIVGERIYIYDNGSIREATRDEVAELILTEI